MESLINIMPLVVGYAQVDDSGRLLVINCDSTRFGSIGGLLIGGGVSFGWLGLDRVCVVVVCRGL
jgi:hypothetical protein